VFRVIGPETRKVREIAYDIVKQNPNVKNPQLDWTEQSPYLKLVVDQDRARALGLTPQDVSQTLAMLISGVQVTTVRDGLEKVSVVARAVPAERLDLAHVGDLTITSETTSPFRCSRSRKSNIRTRSRSCGGAIAATSATACRPPTSLHCGGADHADAWNSHQSLGRLVSSRPLAQLFSAPRSAR
jgi:hypothetical protein